MDVPPELSERRGPVRIASFSSESAKVADAPRPYSADFGDFGPWTIADISSSVVERRRKSTAGCRGLLPVNWVYAGCF